MTDLADRRRQACELRLAGVEWAQIAKQVGYASASGAFDAVQAAIREGVEESAAQVRQQELARLDAMLMGLWTKARRGDAQSVDRVLRIMDRRAHYLGLDLIAEPETVEGVSLVDDLNARRTARRAASQGP